MTFCFRILNTIVSLYVVIYKPSTNQIEPHGGLGVGVDLEA